MTHNHSHVNKQRKKNMRRNEIQRELEQDYKARRQNATTAKPEATESK